MEAIIYTHKNNSSFFGLDMHELFTYTKESDMTALTEEGVEDHLSGYFGVLVETVADGDYQPVKAIAYAGLTKVREYEGERFVQIGGVVCLPAFSGFGFATKAIHKAVQNYPLPEGFAGHAAVANEQSLRLLSGLGMEHVGIVPSESTGIPHPLLIARHGQLNLNGLE